MSLRLKLLLPLLLACLGTLFYVEMVWGPRNLEDETREHLEALESHMDTVTSSLLPLVLTRQLDLIHENMDELKAKNPNWAWVRLEDVEGREYYQSSTAEAVPDRGTPMAWLERDVMLKNRSVGKLKIRVSYEDWLAMARAEQRTIQTILIASTLCLIVMLVFVLEIAVILPLSRVTSATRRLARKDFNLGLPAPGDDEVGKLIEHVHSMGQEIQRYSTNLEAEIQVRQQVESRIRFFKEIVDNSDDAILGLDLDGRVRSWNSGAEKIFGYRAEEMIGESLLRLVPEDRLQEVSDILARIGRGERTVHFETVRLRKGGNPVQISVTLSPVLDEQGHIIGASSIARDISDKKRIEAEIALQHEKIRRLAHHDALTGLPNRALLGDRLDQMLARTRRSQEILALVGLDLDGFKAVNDDWGHEAGDQLLVEIARRLQNVLRAGDTVARIGGDEFVLVLSNVASREECERVLQRVLSVIHRPVRIEDDKESVQVSGSLGYTLFPEDDSDAGTLMRHADAAMYAAKQAGKNRFCRFDLDLDKRQKANAGVLQRLDKGLDRGEFQLFVQPKLNLAEGRICGAEALLRWVHPLRGTVLPAEFLPLVENDYSLALRFDAWVLRAGLELMDQWRRAGLRLPLSLNLSLHPLRQRDLAVRLMELFSEYPGISASDLEIEIPEALALGDVGMVAQTIRECRALGVRFALDDFGTGQSTLGLLGELAVDTLKIDQRFVGDLEMADASQAIVKGAIGMAEAFGCELVGEGIETWGQAHKLLDMGCRVIQGYAVARPMPAAELPGWIGRFRMPAAAMD